MRALAILAAIMMCTAPAVATEASFRCTLLTETKHNHTTPTNDVSYFAIDPVRKTVRDPELQPLYYIAKFSETQITWKDDLARDHTADDPGALAARMTYTLERDTLLLTVEFDDPDDGHIIYRGYCAKKSVNQI